MPPPGTVPNAGICDGSSAANGNNPCDVFTVNNTYMVTWLSCQDLPSGNPPGVNPNTLDFTPTWCLWLNNVSGVSASHFLFTLIVPPNAGGQELDCDASRLTPASNDCPSILPQDGESFLFSFFSDEPVQTNTNFYLITDFQSQPDPAGVVEAVPEPGVLGLFGFGLFAIGLAYGWQQRRRKVRPISAA